MPDTEQDRNSKGQTASAARGNHQNRDAQARSGGLHKSILDAGWGSFVQICSIKAARTGRTLIKVDPAFTSQVCSGCGQVRKKDLSERWHSCECGTELDRDVNAAMNILERRSSLPLGGRTLHSTMSQPHWYLWGLGVEPSSPHQGLGGLLIQPMPILARAGRDGLPCYLETTNEVNVPFYQKHGFSVVGDGVVPGTTLRVWEMRRDEARREKDRERW